MNILVAVGAVNAAFLSVLIQTKKTKTVADNILSFLLFLTSVTFALVFGALEYGREGLLLLLIFSNLLFAPLFYLYVGAMVNPAQRLYKSDLKFFVPWLLANFYLLLTLDHLDAVQIAWFFGEADFSERTATYNFFYLVDLVFDPVFLGLSWLRLQRHSARISGQFSDHQGIDYDWLKSLVIALLVFWGLIEVPLMVSEMFGSQGENWGLVLGFSLASLMVFYLGFHGFRQGLVYSGQAHSSQKNTGPSEPRYAKSGMSEDEAASYRESLVKIMADKRPHLNNDLTIRDLAGLVGLTEHNISEVINTGLGISFFDFINGYRVNEFKARVVMPDAGNLTLLAVALECGFSSKSSFNRIFKKIEGMTPSQYLKSRLSDDSQPA